jgi:hypothetical protein
MYQVASYIRESQLKFRILVSSFSCVIYALSQSCSYSKALPSHFLIHAGLTNIGLLGVSNFLHESLVTHIRGVTSELNIFHILGYDNV